MIVKGQKKGKKRKLKPGRCTTNKNCTSWTKKEKKREIAVSSKECNTHYCFSFNNILSNPFSFNIIIFFEMKKRSVQKIFPFFG